MNPGSTVAHAQLDAFAKTRPASAPLLARLQAARDPETIARLVREALPDAVAAAFGRDEARAVAGLRRRHAEELGISPDDLSFRELFPGLDLGLYGCSHSMGIPSVAGPAAVLDQLGQLGQNGIAVWDEGTWPDVMDQYREACARLVGGSLTTGDVAWAPNVSEALCSVLEGIPGGTLVYTSGHFTTGHYVHHQWAQNTGGTLREVAVDPDGSMPLERLVEALDHDVRVVSLSHALFESGWLQDLPAIAAAVRERAPDALILLDAYQTAGTVPIEADRWGDHVLVTAGGHKQLRSSAGAAFLYVPRRWLGTLTPRRTGWWGHAAPFAFEKGAVRRADDGTRFRTGTPTLAGMAMLLGELATLASSANGSLPDAVARSRRITQGLVERLVERGAERGLAVRGAWPSERRAAFVCLRVRGGVDVTERLGHAGVRVDARPIHDGSGDAWVRVSGSSASFPYEMDAIVELIAQHASPPPR